MRRTCCSTSRAVCNTSSVYLGYLLYLTVNCIVKCDFNEELSLISAFILIEGEANERVRNTKEHKITETSSGT